MQRHRLRCRGCLAAFANVFLRHADSPTGGRMHMTMNRLQCDIQLPGCLPGLVLPDHPKTMWLAAEDIVRSPDVSAWKSALCDGFRLADGFHVLGVDGTMKIAMGVRRDAGTPLTPAQDHVDHDACVLTTRTLQSAVLDLAVVPSDSKPRVVVSALENVLPDDRVGVYWVLRGQRIAGVARRPVVVVSISSGRRAGHVPSPDEVRGRGRITVQRAPGCSVGLSASSTCPSLRRSAQTWTRLNPFGANGTGSSPVSMCSSMTICVARHYPGST